MQNPKIEPGVDDDDEESIDWVNNEAEKLMQNVVVAKPKVFKPLSYEQLNVYVNLLYYQHWWLVIQNDDAIMQTKDWK